jgi:uncharacterized membrane protein
MKTLQFAFKRETVAPMLALTFSSAVCVVMVAARVLSTGNAVYGFLIWNLFLAWLPLLFALLATEHFQRATKRPVRIALLAGAWLLFFPNAPYIFTDLIHLTMVFQRHFWVDLVLILMCALTGLVIGFLSLYLMHSIVSRMMGRAAGWMFIVLSAMLGGFGIYLGRVMRFNSWDVIAQPSKLYHGVGDWTASFDHHPMSVAFPMLFAAFLLVAYVMLYALTHLSPAQPATAPAPASGVRGA